MEPLPFLPWYPLLRFSDGTSVCFSWSNKGASCVKLEVSQKDICYYWPFAYLHSSARGSPLIKWKTANHHFEMIGAIESLVL